MVRYLSAARGSGRSARGYPKTQGRRSSDLRPCASRRVGSPAQLPSCTDTSEKRPRTERGQPWNFARTLFPAAEGRRRTTKKRQAAGRETSGLPHREEFRSPVAASGLHPIEPRRGPGRTSDSADFRAVARPPRKTVSPAGEPVGLTASRRVVPSAVFDCTRSSRVRGGSDRRIWRVSRAGNTFRLSATRTGPCAASCGSRASRTRPARRSRCSRR